METVSGCSLCSHPIHAHGLCNAHYRRFKRHGDPLAGIRPRRPHGLSESEAFAWFMPDDPPAPDICWDWTASTHKGYGQFSMWINGKSIPIPAHQASYRKFVAPIPVGTEILHSCDRPVCVQPAHLSPGAHAQNMREASERGMVATGIHNGRAKLTEADVMWIRNSTLTQQAIADILGVNNSLVSMIRQRKRWAHLP